MTSTAHEAGRKTPAVASTLLRTAAGTTQLVRQQCFAARVYVVVSVIGRDNSTPASTALSSSASAVMCSQVVVNDRAICDGPVFEASIAVSSPQMPACTQ